jgi:hypothetical protein
VLPVVQLHAQVDGDALLLTQAVPRLLQLPALEHTAQLGQPYQPSAHTWQFVPV